MRTCDGDDSARHYFAAQRRAAGLSRSLHSRKISAVSMSINLWQGLVIFVAAFIAGMMNSVAGGGTLITFPALIWIGIDPKAANVTSTVALWPGSLGGVLGVWRER